MELHEIIILTLSVGTLLAGILWVLYQGLRVRWPKGKRFEDRHSNEANITLPHTVHTRPYTVHTVFADGVELKIDQYKVRLAIARAIWASGAAWMLTRKSGRLTKDDSEIFEVVVLIATSDTMETKAKTWGLKKLAGYIDRHQTKQWGGSQLPMAVISELNAQEIIDRGEPVIHEMMHALERDYVGGADDHSNPVVWTAAAVREKVKHKAVQTLARELFTQKPA